MTARSLAVLAALTLLAAIGQLVAVRWSLFGEIAGALLAAVIILAGWRTLAPEMDHVYSLPIAAVIASLLGLALGVAGSAMAYTPALWAIALLAGLPTSFPALWMGMRGARCHLCRRSLRRMLSFVCPRCDLIACEHCWEFERGRCHLCATNQVPLFPVDTAWWQKHFGSQIYEGRCALCLRSPDWKIAHWPCPSCGHTQCRLCWDDNNGQCSRCGWSIQSSSVKTAKHIAPGSENGEQSLQHWTHDEEEIRAQVPDAFRHSSR